MGTWGRRPSCTCGECKKCKHAAYAREWYRNKSVDERRALREQRDPERVRTDDLARYRQQKDDPDFAARRRAIYLLNNAVRDSRITRQPCEGCGAEPAQGHHDDYDKPLDVRWLCTICHAAEHAPEARAA